MNQTDITNSLKERAYDLGFAFVGISPAGFMEEEASRLEEWLGNDYQGKMSYLENHFEKRVDPTKLVPGAKSVVSLMYNYHNPTKQKEGAPKISQYAYGKDYHFVIKHKLKDLLYFLQEKVGHVEGRVFVDSAPVLERDWAKRSGIGWVGKNTLLIHPKAGSYFFLAELIIDLELDYDGPIKDYCGTCTRCIDACPTEAIMPEGYVLDASKCISYLTIELREAIPDQFQSQMEGWMFGCDICQEVCPWNRFSKPHEEAAFAPYPGMLEMDQQEWIELTEETFREIFKKSAVKRTKFAGLKRNIAYLHPDQGQENHGFTSNEE